MKCLIYLLELIDYDHYDETDNEDVEERYIIGYFSNKESLEQAIALCQKRKTPHEEIRISEIAMECGNNQKYVYVLFYEYSIMDNGDWADYYEYFAPQSSYSKCVAQKKQLKQISKYQDNKSRIYDDSIDGFRIEKIKMNYIAHVSYKV